MHMIEFLYILEREIATIVRKNFPLDWKEDVISHSIAKCMRNQFRKTTLRGIRIPLDIEWESYKLHGPRESDHVDIGVLISYRLPSGKVLEGAGFIEAKLRARNSTKFTQVRPKQVNRILKRSPMTRLLLYDYNPVVVLDNLDDEYYFRRLYGHSSSHTSVTTHTPVLPLNLAAAINQYDDELYRYCYSLAHQFVYRYFHLHDLDFSKVAIDAVKGFPGTLGSPNIVMVVRVATEGQELPGVENSKLNSNTYTVLE